MSMSTDKPAKISFLTLSFIFIIVLEIFVLNNFFNKPSEIFWHILVIMSIIVTCLKYILINIYLKRKCDKKIATLFIQNNNYSNFNSKKR